MVNSFDILWNKMFPTPVSPLLSKKILHLIFESSVHLKLFVLYGEK